MRKIKQKDKGGEKKSQIRGKKRHRRFKHPIPDQINARCDYEHSLIESISEG